MSLQSRKKSNKVSNSLEWFYLQVLGFSTILICIKWSAILSQACYVEGDVVVP